MSKFLKWLDNYWYHYKWTTLVVTFFLVLGIILTVQLFEREDYDIYVMYVGNETIPDTQYQDILDSLKAVSKDYNEDKKHLVNFSKTAFISDEENDLASPINAIAKESLQNLLVQPYYIYLMSAAAYELYKDSGVFLPISELVEDIPEEWMYDDTAVYFDKTTYANSFAGVDDLGGDTLLLIKNVPYSPSKSTRTAEQISYNYHLDMLKNILSYEKN